MIVISIAHQVKQFGREARNQDVKGVVFVGAHWEELGDRIRVANKFTPARVQMDMVPPSYWEKYPINVSQELADKVVALLREPQSSFVDVELDPTFDWHDDTVTPLRWMFPDGSPPTTVVSLNARYNPVLHVNLGKVLARLREEGILIVTTGGAVHNLYRNNWLPMVTKQDNFQVGTVPAKWATDFRQSVLDILKYNKVSPIQLHKSKQITLG